MVRVLVFGGWFGSGNLGDDSILIGLKDILSHALPDANIVALSSDPEYTRRVCGVQAVQLRSPRNMLRRGMAYGAVSYVDAFKEADLCLVSGGTPIYDYGHPSRILHFGFPQILGKKLICFGIGAKPVRSRGGRLLIRTLLRQAILISTRDDPSRQLLSSLGVEKPIRVTGDSALLMKPLSVEDGMRFLSENGVDTSKPMVAVCPRILSTNYKAHYHEELTEREILGIRLALARTADCLIDQGYDVVFIPMHRAPQDNDLTEIVATEALMMHKNPKVMRGDLRPREAMAILGCMDLVLGLRLHSLIFAAAQGVPIVSIDYDSKIRGFMELAGAGGFLCGRSVKPGTLMEKVGRALDEGGELGSRLLSSCNVIRARIMEEARSVAATLER